MTIDYAMSVISIVSEHLLPHFPLADPHKQEISEALNLAISALKTINDMNTQGEEHDNT